MNRRQALLGLGALLSGCGGGSGTDDALQVWAMGSEGEHLRGLLPAFEQQHGVRVRVQQVPWSAAHEKLLTAYVGGTLPDVFQLGSTWLSEFVTLGALAPLDGVLDTSSMEDMFPAALAANRLHGQLYALPWYADTRLLFYRRDLLAQVGMAEAPRDWSAWQDALQRLRQAQGHAPLLLPFSEWQTPVALALQQGAQLLRDDGRFGDFTAPAFRHAFAFYLNFFAQGLADIGGEGQIGNLYAAFARGRISMLVTGPWNLGQFAARLPPELQSAWATAPLPAPDGMPFPNASVFGGASLALRADSPRLSAARALLRYLAAPEQQLAFYHLTGDLPVRRSAWQQGGLAHAPHLTAFWQQLQHAKNVPQVAEWERIATAIMRQAERAARKQVSMDEALQTLNRETDALLEKRRWLLQRKVAL